MHVRCVDRIYMVIFSQAVGADIHPPLLQHATVSNNRVVT